MRLDVRAFAITCGLLLGFGLFALTWWAIAFDGATTGPTFPESIYRGYAVTHVGSMIGLMWGQSDGLVGGALFAWLYNLLSSRRSAPQS